MINDDSTGRLRFKHDDLVEWQDVEWDGDAATPVTRRGRIVSIAGGAAVVDTVTGPYRLPFERLRPVKGCA